MKKKAVKYLICFLAVMLLCTVVSRGIYAEQMPIVDVDRPESKSIVHAIEIDGTIISGKEAPVIVQQGIRVESIQAQIGQQVEKGTVLLTLDEEDLDELTEKLQGQIALEQQKISDYNTNNDNSKQLKDKAVTRATEDVTNTTNAQNAAVSAAQSEYDAAVQALANHPTFEEYRKQYNDEEQNTETDDRNATLNDEWQAKKSALEQTVLEKKTQLDTATAAREEAVQQASRALEDAKNPDSTTDNSSLLELEQQLEADQSILAQYQDLLEKKGQITSETTGVVSQILTAPGERTTDGAALLIEDEQAGLYFTGTLAADQREYVSMKDVGNLSLQNGKIQLSEITIQAIAPQEDGSYQVSVPIDSEQASGNSADVSVGDVGTLTVTQQSQDYECCVPLSALFADNSDTYVLVIEETNTFLGTELSVRKVVVQVADKDYEMAALKDAALTQEDRIVTASDRAIFSGDKVRLMEADE